MYILQEITLCIIWLSDKPVGDFFSAGENIDMGNEKQNAQLYTLICPPLL